MNQEEQSWGMACHLAALAGYIIPFGWIVGPLLIWLIKRDRYSFVDYNGKEALNFQLSMLIYEIISALLILAVIGIVLIGIVALIQFIFVIIAAVKASNGEYYRYPLTIRFFR